MQNYLAVAPIVTHFGGFGMRANTMPYLYGLNPSTADENKDDPTIRRCNSFANDWGYGGLCMTNLFAYRATDPSVVLKADDSVQN